MKSSVVEIKNAADIVAARKAGREMAKAFGFGSADQTRLATAISELTRNVIQHAGGNGRCLIMGEAIETIKIRVKVEDQGPGIPNISKAMEWGYSTGNSLGAGLPGTRRLVHDFDIDSRPGHTVVSIAMNRSVGDWKVNRENKVRGTEKQ